MTHIPVHHNAVRCQFSGDMTQFNDNAYITNNFVLASWFGIAVRAISPCHGT